MSLLSCLSVCLMSLVYINLISSSSGPGYMRLYYIPNVSRSTSRRRRDMRLWASLLCLPCWNLLLLLPPPHNSSLAPSVPHLMSSRGNFSKMAVAFLYRNVISAENDFPFRIDEHPKSTTAQEWISLESNEFPFNWWSPPLGLNIWVDTTTTSGLAEYIAATQATHLGPINKCMSSVFFFWCCIYFWKIGKIISVLNSFLILDFLCQGHVTYDGASCQEFGQTEDVNQWQPHCISSIQCPGVVRRVSPPPQSQYHHPTEIINPS